MSIIEAKNIYFTYVDGTCALSGIDFNVEKGEFIGILGANGSGKTTLLRILNGLLKTSSGDVYLDGEDIKSINRDILFRRVCTMFQDPDDQLFSSTVIEDISFGPINMGFTKEEIEKRVKYSLSSVNMLEFADKTISSLSYGQKKRVCLAGVLAMAPEIILLDEPTSSLDPMGVSSIMNLLKKLNVEKKITFVMATHAVDLVPLFIDRVFILSKGRIIREGLPEKVFSDPEVIRSAKLRLPQIGHLFEILKKKDNLPIDNFPLTIGEARREIVKLIPLDKISKELFAEKC